MASLAEIPPRFLETQETGDNRCQVEIVPVPVLRRWTITDNVQSVHLIKILPDVYEDRD